MTFLRPLLLELVHGSIGEVAEVVYLLKSAVHPKAIATCLVTIMLVRAMRHGFRERLWGILAQAGSIKKLFRQTREFYEICHIQNQVSDGTISFPEDNRPPEPGITIEFRNVSFRYPGKEDFVLRNVTFKVEKGQLCVIVGKNGSGKSTVLKLILRLYDPTEGTILVNGQDIKTFKLADLRESMAVLFQDYTHFPLPIKENIALGDPRNADDEARFREAARMTGAEEFVEKMAEGFGTYLQRPISNHWSIPSDAKTRSGVRIDRDLFREVLGHGASDSHIKLAGGQMQRLAVSRMLMRSTLSEEARVRLLLLDEPSAALDPEAEQDLFARFRKLRGEKTMIFSSHRFGQLTKPADLILYMRDSTIVESGTHDELMSREGKYAELWKLQAEAFL